MTVPCHVLISWHLARHVSPNVSTRRWIGWAGVLSDLDGLGLLVDSATGRTHFYEDWHHILGHNFVAAIILSLLAACFCRSAGVGMWAGVSFHLHMAADLASGRGPDGSTWPLIYAWPLARSEWQWDGQWKLDAWPNTAVFLTLLAWALAATYRSGRSPLELVSTRLDQKVIGAFRSVWGSRGEVR